MQKQELIIPLFEDSQKVLADILQKHNLQENEDLICKKIRENKTLNETITIRLIRDLLNERISNTDFAEKLHQQLGTSKEETRALAMDIMDNLVPILEKIPEDKLAEYNRKKELAERGPEPVEETPKKMAVYQKAATAPAAPQSEAQRPEAPKVKTVIQPQAQRAEDPYKEVIE